MTVSLAKITLHYIPKNGMSVEPDNIHTSDVVKIFGKYLKEIAAELYPRDSKVTFTAIRERFTEESAAKVSKATMALILATREWKFTEYCLAKEQKEKDDGTYNLPKELEEKSQEMIKFRKEAFPKATRELEEAKKATGIDVEIEDPEDLWTLR